MKCRGYTGCSEEGVSQGHEHCIRKCWWGDVQNLPGCSRAARKVGGHWDDVAVWSWLATDCTQGRPRDAVGQIGLPQRLLPPCVCFLVQKAPEPADSGHVARAAQSKHGHYIIQVSNKCYAWTLPDSTCACILCTGLADQAWGCCNELWHITDGRKSCCAATRSLMQCFCAEASKQHRMLLSTCSLGRALAKHTCR